MKKDVETIKKILSQYAEEVLCSIDHNLNEWRWDKRLGDVPDYCNIDTKDFDREKFVEKTKSYRKAIYLLIGNEKIHLYHLIHFCEMTDTEARLWIKNNQELMDWMEKIYGEN